MAITQLYLFPPGMGGAINYDCQLIIGDLISQLNTAGVFAPSDATYVTLSTNSSLSSERVLTGTSNQIVVTDNGAGSTVVLSTPQNIHTGATPTFASETLTATSNQLILGTTRTVTLTAPTPASSSRTVTIPDLSANYSVVGTEAAQTINGSKTFSAQIISSATSNHLKLATASNNAIISVASIATADRTITIPDPGANANFVLSEAAATINGQKTFGSAILLPNGLVSACSVGFTNDVDSGMYRTGSHAISFATNSTDALKIDAVQRITQPAQPCFLAFANTGQTNVTGSTNADVTVVFDSEAYDVGSNFASNTFTAPVTGKYKLEATVRVNDLTAAMTRQICKIKTTARTYETDYSLTPAAGTTGTYHVCCLADMTANDTAFVTINIINGATDAVDIIGNATVMRTYFSGSLIN